MGVKPHIQTDANNALNSAYLEALNELTKTKVDEEEKKRYRWIIDGLDARRNPVEVNELILKSYSGKYGNRTVFYENGELYYQYGDRSKIKMIAMSENYFIVEIYDYFRVRFIKENNFVIGFEQVYYDGRVKTYHRE